jgi:hypothetical protein
MLHNNMSVVLSTPLAVPQVYARLRGLRGTRHCNLSWGVMSSRLRAYDHADMYHRLDYFDPALLVLARYSHSS